ncbi:MAG: hypothetical protein GVY04_03860 [Cyanobacteria bacterium]|nr:hypothetical protein [Cyanobacteria bacterium GSL.Bin1]
MTPDRWEKAGSLIGLVGVWVIIYAPSN